MHGYVLHRLRFTIVFLLFLAISKTGYSSHVIGGDITYTFLSYDQDTTEVRYEVKMVLYRDPTGIDFDTYASFGIFKQRENGEWDSYKVIPRILRDEIEEYDPLGDDCKTRFLSDARLEFTSYTFEITVEITDGNYMIAYQKCCRNYTINNVLGDGELGAVYDIIITPAAMRSGNSSPEFGPIPPLFVCSGYDLRIDHSATDIDGDSLVYKFCTPLYPGIEDVNAENGDCCGCTNPDPAICTPPYPSLVYEGDFSPQDPMGGSPKVAIDYQTGIITGKPELLGPYVVVVCVDEYRDGILLSTVRRDFELNSIICSDYLKAEVYSDSNYIHQETGKTVAYYESCNDTRFTIQNLSRDERYIADYIWEVYDANDNLVYDRSGLSSRDITLELPGPGDYKGYMILNDNESCFDTAFLSFVVAPDVVLGFKYDHDKCTAGPTQFKNLSSEIDRVVAWEWDFGDGNFSYAKEPDHTYFEEGSYQVKLSATDSQGCLVSFLDQVTYELFAKDNTAIAQEVCHGESFLFGNRELMNPGRYELVLKDANGCDSIIILNLSVLQNSYDEHADTICSGDDLMFAEQLVSETGVYIDTLANQFGCDSIVLLDLHVAQNLTKLDLDSPLEYDYGSTVTLVPSVEGGELIYKQWSNDKKVLSNTLVLNYIIEKDEWLFFESMNELYCFAQDSAFIRSNIVKGIYVPNIFSPNEDGDNDKFTVGTTRSIKLLNMKIYDRWGNQIFQSQDTNKSNSLVAWDGTFDGKPADVGVYVYSIEYEYVDGDRSSSTGSVHLIR